MDINDAATGLLLAMTKICADHYLWDGDGCWCRATDRQSEVLARKSPPRCSRAANRHSMKMHRIRPSDGAGLVATGDNVQLLAMYSAQASAIYYYALADRLYLTYRAVVRGEHADPDDMLSFDKEAIGEKML